MINEGIKEVASNFKDFNDFKTRTANDNNGLMYVYTSMSGGQSLIKNLSANGAEGSQEFVHSFCHGIGFYSVPTWEQAKDVQRGTLIVKSIVKRNAFDRFLIFDEYNPSSKKFRPYLVEHGGLSKKYLHETDEENLKRLIPQNSEAYNRLSNVGFKYAMSNRFNSRVRDALKNGKRVRVNNVSSYEPDEYLIDQTLIDGWIYNHYGWMTIVFRTYDNFIPYKVYENDTWNWPDYEFQMSPNKTYNLINSEEDFNNVHFLIDGYRRGRRQYDQTKYINKTIMGFSVVRGSNGSNLMSAVTGKYFSKYPLDFVDTPDVNKGVITFGYHNLVDDEDNSTYTGTFILKTQDYGQTFDLYWSTEDNPLNDNGAEELTYDDFNQLNDWIHEDNPRFAKKQGPLNEVFTHSSYEDFMKLANDSNSTYELTNFDYSKKHRVPRYAIVYHGTDVADSIFKNGPAREWSGKSGIGKDDTLYYGLGVYTVYNKNHLKLSKYGTQFIKFAVKDGFKDFIIFDNDVRSVFDPGQTVYDEIVRLCPQKVIDEINANFKKNDRIDGDIKHRLQTLGCKAYMDTSHTKAQRVYRDVLTPQGIDQVSYPVNSSAMYGKAFAEAICGDVINDAVSRKVKDERLLSATKIRGFVYTGHQDGCCVCIRDFNSLMPLEVCEVKNDGSVVTVRTLDKDSFNARNIDVDPYFSYRNNYSDIRHISKSSMGFSSVSRRNKNSEEKNIIEGWWHRPLMPADADEGSDAFNVNSKTAFLTYYIDDGEGKNGEPSVYRFDFILNDDMTITASLNGELVDGEDIYDFFDNCNQYKCFVRENDGTKRLYKNAWFAKNRGDQPVIDKDQKPASAPVNESKTMINETNAGDNFTNRFLNLIKLSEEFKANDMVPIFNIESQKDIDELQSDADLLTSKEMVKSFFKGPDFDCTPLFYGDPGSDMNSQAKQFAACKILNIPVRNTESIYYKQAIELTSPERRARAQRAVDKTAEKQAVAGAKTKNLPKWKEDYIGEANTFLNFPAFNYCSAIDKFPEGINLDDNKEIVERRLEKVLKDDKGFRMFKDICMNLIVKDTMYFDGTGIYIPKFKSARMQDGVLVFDKPLPPFVNDVLNFKGYKPYIDTRRRTLVKLNPSSHKEWIFYPFNFQKYLEDKINL